MNSSVPRRAGILILPRATSTFFEFDSDQTNLANRFFGLLEDLEQLLGQRVDLVSSRDAHNPYFLQVADQYRVTLCNVPMLRSDVQTLLANA